MGDPSASTLRPHRGGEAHGAVEAGGVSEVSQARRLTIARAGPAERAPSCLDYLLDLDAGQADEFAVFFVVAGDARIELFRSG